MATDPAATEITIESWEHFVRMVSRADNPSEIRRPTYLYRGHACGDWSLLPSLTRLAREKQLTPSAALELEKELLAEFTSQAHLHLRDAIVVDEDITGLWTFMQHYGAPTRAALPTEESRRAFLFRLTERLRTQIQEGVDDICREHPPLRLA